MKIAKKVVWVLLLALMEVLILSGCGTPITPTLDLQGTIEAATATATAVASQPTPDATATYAAIATEIAATQAAQEGPTVTTGCYDVGDLRWCNTSGSVERKDDSIVLHNSIQKTEMLGNVVSENLDCVFVLKFDRGMSDSSVGLEIWDPTEYSITFRGGAIKVVTAGIVVGTKEVASYIGERIEVHLRVSDERLFAAIDGDTLLDEENTYWEGQVVRPRLNADIGDTVTLYSSSCTTE